DDFAQTGSRNQVASLHKSADQVFRGQGNKNGRQRLSSEAELKTEMFPRGLIVSSGEDTPKGKSLRARLFIVDIQKGDIDIAKVTRVQAYAKTNRLAGAMFAYIQWLAGHFDNLKMHLNERQQKLREEVGETAHARLADNIASLLIGLETFLSF